MHDRHDNDMTARHTPVPSGPKGLRRTQGTDARRRAAGPQRSRRLTERLGVCLQRSSVFGDESARDLAQLLIVSVAALAVMALVGRLFFGAN